MLVLSENRQCEKAESRVDSVNKKTDREAKSGLSVCKIIGDSADMNSLILQRLLI